MAHATHSHFSPSSAAAAPAFLAGCEVREITATPKHMADAGVPFDLAAWYHAIGRRITNPCGEDLDKIMSVHLQIAQAGV